MEVVFSKDNQICAVKVQLLNKNILDRTTNHLYPLEIPSVVDIESEFNVNNNKTVTTDKGSLKEPRPVRNAAIEARQKLKDHLQLESINVIFSFPRGSVMDRRFYDTTEFMTPPITQIPWQPLKKGTYGAY